MQGDFISIHAEGKMKALLTVRPGARGTKRLLEVYGDALFRVRYRYDEKSRTRVKTAEIIVERKAWDPPLSRFQDNDMVPIRIAYAEHELKRLAKAAGGRWDPDARVWLVPYGKIKGTKLNKHITVDAKAGR